MRAPALLRGADADRAREAASRFSAALLASDAEHHGYDMSVGDAGLALVHLALHSAFPGKGHLLSADRCLQRAIDAIGAGGAGPSLWNGFTGVGWVTEFAGARDSNDEEDAIGEALLTILQGWGGLYDLVDGLAGFAVYALERLPGTIAARLLETIVALLAKTAATREPGIAWRFDTASLGSMSPEWNLGVAHGVPGVIAILGRICASNIAEGTRMEARALLDGAVAWLLAQRLPMGAGGTFPSGVGQRGSVRLARAAWCYGDPGVAAALLLAAQCTGERAWKSEATRIALESTTRTEVSCGVQDAGLCHGAAGLGHLYHRLYLGTGDDRLAGAARQWLMRAVAMSRESARFVWTQADSTGSHTSHPGVLAGAGGVVLALLAATGDAAPSWDRALGLSSA